MNMTEGKEPENSSIAAAVEKKHPANGLNFTEKISDVLLKLKPAIETVSRGIETAQPYVSKGYKLAGHNWKKLEPYQPELLIPAFLGLACVFASGVFPTIIASVEAIRTSGTWPGIQSSIKSLRSNYDAAKSALDKDDMIDADRNGVPDVLQLKRKAVVQRKGLVFLKSINTEQVSDACQQLGTALFAVLATLRLHIAYVLTIGTSIAKMSQESFGVIAIDSVSNALPEDSRRLAPFIVLTFFRVVGFFIAWILTRYVCAFYAAMKGARVFVESMISYLKLKNKLPGDHILIQHKTEISSALGGFGFIFQCYMGFQLILVLRFILFPLCAIEWIVTVFFSLLV